jgi:hypothetical protein
MAKRTITKITTNDEEEDRTERIARDIEADPAEINFSQYVAQFRGAQGCQVKVHRQTQRGRQYCFFGTPEEISEESIRAYHAQQPYAGEEGLYFLSVVVNGELRSCFPIHIAPQVGTSGAPASLGGPSGGMADVVRLLQAQNDRLEQRLMMQERTPMVDMIDAMAKLDAMRGDRQLPLDSLIKAIEIGQKMNGAGAADWTMLLAETVKENIPALLALAKTMSAKVQQQQAGQLQEATPITPATTTTGEGMNPTEQERAMMAEGIAWLKRKALAGSDPGLYIDVIVDNREDPLYARLISQIVEQDFSAFAAIDPDIEKPQYNEFFRALYDGIRSVFVPKSPVARDSGGPNGNAPDTSANGATGKSGGK